MLERREGFTLIEILTVVVIVGILAAIAIPRFTKAREKANFSQMMSDLRNLQSHQELYYTNPANARQYAAAVADLTDFAPSDGVLVTITQSATTGWAATASHIALDASTQSCAIFVGEAAAEAPATNPGVVTCTGE